MAASTPLVASAAVGLGFALLALLGCGGASTGKEATTSEAADAASTTTGNVPPGVIAYQTFEGTLRVIRSDGSDDHELVTDVPGEHLQPDWSPDGQHLVFTSRSSGDVLYEADTDGSNARQIVKCVYPCIGDESASYSPDGRRIAFIRALGPFTGVPADCGLWLFDRSTGKVTQLTSHPKCQDREAYPRWSPDGSTLVFFRDLNDKDNPAVTVTQAVFTMPADGGNQRQLTPLKLVAGNPDWSPDGRLIVFSTFSLGFFPDAKVSNIYTMRPDGTNTRQLTNYTATQGRASHPHWLPDGSGIIYVLGRRGHREMWFMTPDGENRVRIKTGGDSWHPTWQPNP